MMRSVHGWWFGCLLLAGCGGEEEVAAPGSPRRVRDEWRTTAWPMARGGRELQGRVRDPVPRGPRVEWTFDAGAGVFGGAAVVDGLAVVGDDEGRVHAIDLEKREERWVFDAGGAVDGVPAVAAGRVFVGSADDRFFALDLATGEERWRIDGRHKFPTGAVVIDGPDGELVLVNGYDGVTRCLRAADGGVVWSHESDDHINGSPSVIGGELVAFGGCDAVIHTIRVSDGGRVGGVECEAQIIDSVATFGESIYCGTYAGQVVAADLRAGKVEWIYQAGDSAFFTAPGVDDERVFVGARDGSLHAIDRRTGDGQWKFRAGDGIEGAPLVFDDAVVVGSADGRLYAVDKEDGSEIWSLDLGEGLAAAPAFAGGRIVVGGEDGTVFVVVEALSNEP